MHIWLQIMYRSIFSIILCFVTVGCSSLGDIRGTPEGMRTYDSTCKVLTGHSCGKSTVNAAEINKTVGQLRQMPYHIRSGKTPQKVSETLELLR